MTTDKRHICFINIENYKKLYPLISWYPEIKKTIVDEDKYCYYIENHLAIDRLYEGKDYIVKPTIIRDKQT
jgi:hypothetical protein